MVVLHMKTLEIGAPSQGLTLFAGVLFGSNTPTLTIFVVVVIYR
jgi:hypothetical protein